MSRCSRVPRIMLLAIKEYSHALAEPALGYSSQCTPRYVDPEELTHLTIDMLSVLVTSTVSYCTADDAIEYLVNIYKKAKEKGSISAKEVLNEIKCKKVREQVKAFFECCAEMLGAEGIEELYLEPISEYSYLCKLKQN